MMAEKRFWFKRIKPHGPHFMVRPTDSTGLLVLIGYVMGLVAFFFGGAGFLIVGDTLTASMLFGLGALFLLGGMRLIWAKTDPHAPTAPETPPEG